MARIPASGAEQHERFQKKLLVQSFSRRGKQAMETSLKGEEDGEEDEGPTTLDTKETPLEKQVIALKKKHPGILLVVEVGYKYHFYGSDAEIASKVRNSQHFATIWGV
jgi:DNA mismatch repair protein MSH3